MRCNCNFNINPAFAAGVTLLWISLLIRNVLELGGPAAAAAHLLSGAACALLLIGLLYGSPKTRPVFDGYKAAKYSKKYLAQHEAELMHLFDASDFERSLRRRRLAGFGLLAVGLTGLVCYLLLIHDSDVLPAFARGFYLGGSSGIAIGSVFLLVRMQYLLTHPATRKKAKIQEQDEREKAILNQSYQFAGMFTFFAAACSMFVLVAVSMEAALAVHAVVWLIANLYLSKKL